jgi:hypothetical protein
LQLLAILGGLLVVLGAFLPWAGDKILGIGGQTASSFDAPVSVLWDMTPPDLFFKLGYLLVILGALGLASALVPALARLGRLAGALVVVTVGLFALTELRGLSQIDALTVKNAFRVVAIGAFVSLIGAILLLVSPSRRTPAG